jgi:hypothetical protein
MTKTRLPCFHVFRLSLAFHPRCCLPRPAASGSGGGEKPLRSHRSGDQGERGPRLPARYGSVPINDVRSNAAGSPSILIVDEHSFQVYIQFNDASAAYVTMLPATYAAGCQHVAIPHCKLFPSEAPNCNACLPKNCPPKNCLREKTKLSGRICSTELPVDRLHLIYSCSLAAPLMPAHWPSPADYRPATPSQCCCPAHPNATLCTRK